MMKHPSKQRLTALCFFASMILCLTTAPVKGVDPKPDPKTVIKVMSNKLYDFIEVLKKGVVPAKGDIDQVGEAQQLLITWIVPHLSVKKQREDNFSFEVNQSVINNLIQGTTRDTFGVALFVDTLAKFLDSSTCMVDKKKYAILESLLITSVEIDGKKQRVISPVIGSMVQALANDMPKNISFPLGETQKKKLAELKDIYRNLIGSFFHLVILNHYQQGNTFNDKTIGSIIQRAIKAISLVEDSAANDDFKKHIAKLLTTLNTALRNLITHKPTFFNEYCDLLNSFINKEWEENLLYRAVAQADEWAEKEVDYTSDLLALFVADKVLPFYGNDAQVAADITTYGKSAPPTKKITTDLLTHIASVVAGTQDPVALKKEITRLRQQALSHAIHLAFMRGILASPANFAELKNIQANLSQYAIPPEHTVQDYHDWIESLIQNEPHWRILLPNALPKKEKKLQEAIANNEKELKAKIDQLQQEISSTFVPKPYPDPKKETPPLVIALLGAARTLLAKVLHDFDTARAMLNGTLLKATDHIVIPSPAEIYPPEGDPKKITAKSKWLVNYLNQTKAIAEVIYHNDPLTKANQQSLKIIEENLAKLGNDFRKSVYRWIGGEDQYLPTVAGHYTPKPEDVTPAKKGNILEELTDTDLQLTILKGLL